MWTEANYNLTRFVNECEFFEASSPLSGFVVKGSDAVAGVVKGQTQRT